MTTYRYPSSPTGRITLVLLAVVAVAIAYPWQAARERWLLGAAVAVVVVSLARWRGLALTTMLRRRVGMLLRTRGGHPNHGAAAVSRTTALLRVTPPDPAADALPLPLIARYLDRYGLRADAVRVVSRDTSTESGVRERETWIGVTFAAADNLAALQARSAQIPLQTTAEVAVRRLADHLRETGWAATTVDPEEIPPVVAPAGRETWHAVDEPGGQHVAAYRVTVDDALASTLEAIWAYPARETWSVLQMAGSAERRTLAVACAFRTDSGPGRGAPLPGLAPQSGNHRPALAASHPSSTQLLDGHAVPPAGTLAQLHWPSSARQPSEPRRATASRT
ncbi:type VII secretion protein EccE [Mycobacterium sp.]|uniref:type VII secretion protein EccE n=1 Tax=Mycobacterium sp. TaxID=1785 RepID=UPI0031D0110B